MEATPKFAFNMRILAVKDGEHPRSHSIKEEPVKCANADDAQRPRSRATHLWR